MRLSGKKDINVMVMVVKVTVMFELLGLRLTMTWYDPFMRWNASEHNNIEVASQYDPWMDLRLCHLHFTERQ